MANANEIIELNCHVTSEVAHMNVGNKYLFKIQECIAVIVYYSFMCFMC